MVDILSDGAPEAMSHRYLCVYLDYSYSPGADAKKRCFRLHSSKLEARAFGARSGFSFAWKWGRGGWKVSVAETGEVEWFQVIICSACKIWLFICCSVRYFVNALSYIRFHLCD